MLAMLDKLQSEAIEDIAQVETIDALELWRISYLGSKGRLKQLMPLLKDVSAED